MWHRTAVTTGALLAAGTLSAMAADLPVRSAPPAMPVAAPVYNWTGLYAGLRAGYGFGGDDKWGISNVGGGLVNRNAGQVGLRGGLFGVFAGYNWQFASTPVVVGVEGDFNIGQLKRNLSANPVVPFGLPLSAHSTSNWNGSLRLRAGYAFDRLLVYGTGGVAFLGNKYWGQVGATPVIWSKNETFTGWTVGGGLDYAFTQNIFAGVDYRYTAMPKKILADATNSFTTIRTPNFHAVTLRIGAKF